MQNVAVSGSLYAPNTLSASAFYNVGQNSVPVSIAMDNYSDITAVQLDFRFPNRQFTVSASDFQATPRAQNHQLSAFSINDSTWRVIMFSMQNELITDHSGDLIRVLLYPKENISTTTYLIAIDNIVLSDISSNNKFSGDNPTAYFTICQDVTISDSLSLCASDLPYHYINGEIDTIFQIGTPALSTSYFLLHTAAGCDSMVTLTLTVNPLPTVTISGNTEIHAGDSTTLTATGAVDYLWSTMETTPSIWITPTDTTVYLVIGADTNGCIGYDTVTVNVATGIAHYDLNNNILLFPNPATHFVKLQITNYKLQIIEVEVLDMMGKIVKTTHALNPQSATINVTNLSPCTYFVRVTTSDGNVLTKKMIKQ